MGTETKTGPDAAATAIRTPAVNSLGKQTVLFSPESEAGASEFSQLGGAK
jgi:hypothetical protein